MIDPGQLLERAAELRARGERFALATVVRSRRPASARPGDRALVTADGSMQGWVGGSCAQDTIRREALRSLAEGNPRLVRLSPDALPGQGEEGVVSYPMTCHSGGTLEVYVEPFLPPPRLLVVGESPVAEGLAALAPTLGFAVAAQSDPAVPLAVPQPADTWVVLAGMGDHDELAAGVPYVALVASRRRAAGILEYLRERGLGNLGEARLKAPAGLDIGARTGAEVALSILAEIVQRRRQAPPHPDPLPQGGEGEGSAPRASFPLPAGEGQGEGRPSPPATAIDPVCGMEVEIATARWTSDHDGRTVYFCAPGCKRHFDRDPAAYLPASNGGGG